MMLRMLLALALVAVTACTRPQTPAALIPSQPGCAYAASGDHSGSPEMVQLRQQCGLKP